MKSLEKAEFFILLCTILVGGFISFFDFIGAFENIAWLRAKIPSITLMILTLIATSLLLNIHNNHQTLKSILPRGTFKHFSTSEDLLAYLLNRMKYAKREVCDLSMVQFIKRPLFYSTEQFEEYINIVNVTSKKIPFREIILLSNIHMVNKARRLISNAGDKYELSIYHRINGHVFPIWNFIVIDDEVILLTGKLSVKQPIVVDYFKRYYEELWENAVKIKSGAYRDIGPLDAAEIEVSKGV